jgi:hypothetical protein
LEAKLNSIDDPSSDHAEATGSAVMHDMSTPHRPEVQHGDPNAGTLHDILKMLTNYQEDMNKMKADMNWYNENWNSWKGQPGDAGGAVGAVTQPLAPIDRKIVEKPFKYSGDTKTFIQWQMRFKDYLSVYDSRWSMLLGAIEDQGETITTGYTDIVIAKRLDIEGHLNDFKKQLYFYMTTFTEGAPLLTITSAGYEAIMESYRRIADTGRSRRPEHILRLNTEVLQPPNAKDLKELDSKITTWEYNITYFHRVAPANSHISEAQRRLILINMTPRELCEYLTRESRKFETYEHVRTEIYDWIHRATNPKTMSGALNQLKDDDGEDWEADIELTGDINADNQILLNALVKNSNLKFRGGKDKGKGKKGSKS